LGYLLPFAFSTQWAIRLLRIYRVHTIYRLSGNRLEAYSSTSAFLDIDWLNYRQGGEFVKPEFTQNMANDTYAGMTRITILIHGQCYTYFVIIFTK
jgi:hypothetical protein